MSGPTRFEIRSETAPGGAHLRVHGELDIATVAQLEGAVSVALAGTTRSIVIDMRGLTFIDSSGLRLLILLADRAREEGWELALIRPGPPTLAVFQLTGAEDSLPFLDEAAQI
jgi:anti-anti-sigma factor